MVEKIAVIDKVINFSHSDGWDIAFFSSHWEVESNSNSIMKVLTKPELLFELTEDRNVIIYLPFIRNISGLTLKRAFVGKLDGPIVQGDVVKYKITSNNFRYLFSFEINEESELTTKLFVYSYLMIKLGLIDRILAPDKKKLMELLSPENVIKKIFENTIQILL